MEFELDFGRCEGPATASLHSARSGEAASHALSVKIELQADCFAGVWARRAQQERGWRLEQGDIETALNAASTALSSRICRSPT